VKAMVQAEWSRAAVHQDSKRLRETIGYVSALIEGFHGEAAQWDSYVKDGKPLFMAYISSFDDTLQWYALVLPKGWDPEKSYQEQPAYPMFFELHGGGSGHYLNYIASQLGQGDAVIGELGYDDYPTFAMKQRNGYHVFPFCRGNIGFAETGTNDIFDAAVTSTKGGCGLAFVPPD